MELNTPILFLKLSHELGGHYKDSLTFLVPVTTQLLSRLSSMMEQRFAVVHLFVCRTCSWVSPHTYSAGIPHELILSSNTIKKKKVFPRVWWLTQDWPELYHSELWFLTKLEIRVRVSWTESCPGHRQATPWHLTEDWPTWPDPR